MLVDDNEYSNVNTKKWMSLFSCTAICFGTEAIGSFEGDGNGITWDNYQVRHGPVCLRPSCAYVQDGPLPLRDCMTMLLVDIVLYAALALYIEVVTVICSKHAFPFEK